MFIKRAVQQLSIFSRLENPTNGRYIDVFTTEPGLDVYFSSRMKPNLYGKDGAMYGPFEDGGVCLIPMQLPSGVNMVSKYNILKQNQS